MTDRLMEENPEGPMRQGLQFLALRNGYYFATSTHGSALLSKNPKFEPTAIG